MFGIDATIAPFGNSRSFASLRASSGEFICSNTSLKNMQSNWGSCGKQQALNSEQITLSRTIEALAAAAEFISTPQTSQLNWVFKLNPNAPRSEEHTSESSHAN